MPVRKNKMKDTYTKKRLARLKELQNNIRNMSLDEFLDNNEVPEILVDRVVR